MQRSVERLYHSLSQNTHSGLREILSVILDSLAVVAGLGDEAKNAEAFFEECSSIISHVSVETKEPNVVMWADRLSGFIRAAEESTSEIAGVATELFIPLGNLTDLDEPRRSIAFLICGAAYGLESNFKQALVHFSEATELQPENWVNYLWRGQSHYALKDDPAALADFTKAIELQPANGYNYYWRGRTHRNLNGYPAALADFTKAIELQSEDGDNYYWRGLTHRDLKDHPAALADFTKAIELQPENGYNYHWRGRTHRDLNDYPAALADFTKAIELKPEDRANYYWRGLTHYQLKDYPAALADFTKAIELEPDDSYNFRWRAHTYQLMGNYTDALADYAHAVELTPNDSWPVFATACVFALQKEVEQACSWLRRAIILDRKHLDEARADSDFDSIRETAEFKALMDEFGGDEKSTD